MHAAWLLLGALAWYAGAAVWVRQLPDRHPIDGEPISPNDRLMLWLLSPLVLPMALLVTPADWFARRALTPWPSAPAPTPAGPGRSDR